MAMDWSTGARVGCWSIKVVLLALLVNWIAAAPLIWILRDGLAPGMVESVGMQAVWKFLIGWGVPALMLVVPLVALWTIERRLARSHGQSPVGE